MFQLSWKKPIKFFPVFLLLCFMITECTKIKIYGDPTVNDAQFTIYVTSDGKGAILNSGINTVAEEESLIIYAGDGETGYEFSHWDVGVSPSFSINDIRSNTTTITDITGDDTVIAIFKKQVCTLTVNCSDGGTVTNDDGSALQPTYPFGTELTVRANPTRGYYISSWTGDASGIDATTTIIINGNKTVGVDFAEIIVPEDVICVDARSTYSGINKGNSWARAYGNMVDAINALNTNTTKTQVWVAGGTYPISSRLEPKANSKMYGGFSAFEASLNERVFYRYPTIMDGSVDRIVSLVNKPRVVIDGFIIQGATGYAVYMSGSVGGQKISNSVLRNNVGNAFMIREANVEISNCVIRDNVNSSGDLGSGLFVQSEGLKVSNCVFYNNTGNAICDYNENSENLNRYVNCTIYNNTGSNHSGGIFSYDGKMALYGCIVYGNQNKSNTGGTQINKVYRTYDCTIQDTTVGVGIGERLGGAWENVDEIDPHFPSVTSNDSLWFVPTVSRIQGVLIPAESSLSMYCTNILYSSSKDIRGRIRDADNNRTLSAGAYEY